MPPTLKKLRMHYCFGVVRDSVHALFHLSHVLMHAMSYELRMLGF